MRSLTLLFALVLSLAPLQAVTKASAEPAILTVTGGIGKTNRGPFDAFGDALFAKLEVQFERAYALTYADLKALPQVALTVKYDNWPSEVEVSGPLLSDVLDLTGAEGATVIVRAVDGYAPEFDREDIDGGQFVLAIDWAGKPLSVGGRGPVWLVFPPDSMEDQPETDDGLTWAAFHVEVR
jgi:hypothetical protein